MSDLNSMLENLAANTINSANSFKPLFFRIYNDTELIEFNKVLNYSGLHVFDFVSDQLKELIKVKNPSVKFTDEAIQTEINKHVTPHTLITYGVWVYYPWSNRLVHILDEEEFIEVRTSRNQYKITKEERDILATKKIGVIGLSVGQSVSVTLAMERICGELRLADFDVLELTNLNRIRTGVHNLGLLKVYAVAREIAEIDPFIRVKCFADGVTEQNIDTFFTDDGKLDLLIEESDGFDIKILSRYKARSLKIPVLMEASDRCMVDVERFDLEPERPILHGLVEHLDIDTLKSLKTTEEKIPYMLDILGLDTSSIRLKASMLEIEQSINTWPQLASAVTMGGGIAADVSRRLLLNQYTQSGRYHVDIEEIIGDKIQTEVLSTGEFNFPEISIEFMKKCIAQLPQHSPFDLPVEIPTKWVAEAIKAPSAGNNQPWKWLISEAGLFLFHDIKQSAGWTDPFNHLAQMAFGSAIENLKLAAHQDGYLTTINYYPLKDEPLLVASFQFEKTNIIDATDAQLFKAIDLRCTNRKKGLNKKIDSAIFENLKTQAIKGNFAYVENTKDIKQLSEIVSTIERIRFLNADGHKEFFQKEIRWNEKEVLESKDGIDIETLELSFTDQTGLHVASETAVIDKVREWNGGGALQKLTRDAILESSAIGLLSIADCENLQLQGGQLLQRIWLAANSSGLAFHPISSPLFFFDRIKKINDLNSNETELIKKQEALFEKIFPPIKEYTPIFLFRLSLADNPTKRSLRRDLKDTLTIIKPIHVQI